MALSTRAIGTTAALLFTAGAPEAGAVVSERDVQSPSVEQRVAAIRAKAAELSAAGLRDTAVPSFDPPAQVAWNDWRNQ
jgi:hypothetical protein